MSRKISTNLRITPSQEKFYRALGRGNLSKGLGIALDAVNRADTSYLDTIASVLSGKNSADQVLVMERVRGAEDEREAIKTGHVARCDGCGGYIKPELIHPRKGWECECDSTSATYLPECEP